MKCEFCTLKKNSLKRCSKCQDTYYCSTECQKSDWTFHKHICKKHEPIRLSVDSEIIAPVKSVVLLCGSLLNIVEEYLSVRDVITTKVRYKFKTQIYQVIVKLVEISKKKLSFHKLEKFLTKSLNYYGILLLAVKYSYILKPEIKNSFGKSRRRYNYYLTISDDINYISKRFKTKNLKNLKKCGVFFDMPPPKFTDEHLDYQKIIPHIKFEYNKMIDKFNFKYTDDLEPEKNNKVLWNKLKDGIKCFSVIYDFLDDVDSDILTNILWMKIIKYLRNTKGKETFYDVEKKIRKELRDSIVFIVAEKSEYPIKQDVFGNYFFSNYVVRFYIGQRIFDKNTTMHDYSLKNINKLKLSGLPVLLTD